MLVEERREQFKADVAALKLRTGRSRRDGVLRVVGAVLMVGGAASALLVYLDSLGQDDLRNIASYQILATALLGLTVIGASLYLAGAIAAVLRLWLLRQLYQGEQQLDQLTEALRASQP